MCDTLYLNPFANFKQWYTPYEKNRKKIVRLNTVILTKVKVKWINHVALPDISSNIYIGDVIMLGDVYVCDDTHYEIL